MSDSSPSITLLLNEISKGSDEAYSKLFPIVYNTLRNMAYRQIAYERMDTYTKTALVHELYLKMLNQKKIDWEGRNHFFAIAARCMRQILIDHARKKKRAKRGGSKKDVTYIDEIVSVKKEADNLIQIDEALNKLGQLDQRLAKIVELHYFGEMSFDDIAELLNISERTVYRDWAKARGWLYKEMKNRF